MLMLNVSFDPATLSVSVQAPVAPAVAAMILGAALALVRQEILAERLGAPARSAVVLAQPGINGRAGIDDRASPRG